jgi:site-specific DNA recombinase
VALVSVAESLVSQWEREAIGERTRDAMRHKRNQGERVGNIAFGCRLAGDGQHLEPDPPEQAALAEIRLLRNRGLTLRGIAAALNHRAFRTRRGTEWRLESVARVLKNKFAERAGSPAKSA